MYCEAKTSQARESAVVALCYVLENLVSALLPIITFTIDELYPHLPAYLRKQHNTIWTIPWPMEGAYADESFDESFWKQVHHQFHSTFDQLKKDGVVKDLLDLVVSCDKPFNQDGDILGVSLLGFDLDDTLLFGHKPLAIFEVAGNAFKVYKSNLQKCPRCWKRLAHAEGELCDRCKTVVQHAIN